MSLRNTLSVSYKVCVVHSFGCSISDRNAEELPVVGCRGWVIVQGFPLV